MLRILTYPDPKLRGRSSPVTEFDPSLHKFLDAMIEAMRRAGGIGLAAPQVGVLKRIFVVEIEDEKSGTRRLYELINPVISNKTGTIAFDEGCLSFPGLTYSIQRSRSLTVEYLDRNRQLQHLSATDLLAVVIQHENDHLNGVLFIDRLPFWKKTLMRMGLLKTARSR